MTVLTNDFHRTEVNTHLHLGINYVSASTVRRWRRALCGMVDCHCGDVRGPHYMGDQRVNVYIDPSSFAGDYIVQVIEA